MEDPTLEAVVVHSRRPRRLGTELRDIRPGLNSTETDSACREAQGHLSGAHEKVTKGSHDAQAELVPVEKKDHLGLLSTMWVIRLLRVNPQPGIERVLCL
jgi:hypothetical protein